MELVPRMAEAPPAGYLAFVERHLAPLAADAARVLGADGDVDALRTAVLADVARRWRWLELLRTRLGRPEAAEAYTSRAFARRAQRWPRPSEEDDGVDFAVWAGDAGPAGPPPRGPARMSVAVRIAPTLVGPARTNFGAEVEAAIAWNGAYHTARRRRWIAQAVLVFVAVAVFMRLYQDAGLGFA
jgi:hypothetical protein